MRNILGGFIGASIGAYLLVVLIGLTGPPLEYPYPITLIWSILVGSSHLQASVTGFLNQSTFISYLLAWLIIGLIIAPFSKRGWNTIRTTLWAGFFIGFFALLDVLLTSPFWSSPNRNFDLVYMFTTSLLLSFCSIPSAYPITIAINKLQQGAEPPIPDRIETRCECGAVFKSNPLICSECGAALRACATIDRE